MLLVMAGPIDTAAKRKEANAKRQATRQKRDRAREERAGQLTFATQFVAWREATGYSQHELAAESGVTQPFISKIERGLSQQPRPDILARLATALRVPLVDMLVATGWVTREDLGTLPIEPDLEALILAVRADPDLMQQIRSLGGDENAVLRDVVAAMKVPLTTHLRARKATDE